MPNFHKDDAIKPIDMHHLSENDLELSTMRPYRDEQISSQVEVL